LFFSGFPLLIIIPLFLHQSPPPELILFAEISVQTPNSRQFHIEITASSAAANTNSGEWWDN
jgi:hypothetical protein